MSYDDLILHDTEFEVTLLDTAKAKGINNFVYAGLTYDALTLVTRAIAEVGYDGERIKNWLYALPEFNGVGGTYHFDKDGEPNISLQKKIFKNGGLVPFQ